MDTKTQILRDIAHQFGYDIVEIQVVDEPEEMPEVVAESRIAFYDLMDTATKLKNHGYINKAMAIVLHMRAIQQASIMRNAFDEYAEIFIETFYDRIETDFYRVNS